MNQTDSDLCSDLPYLSEVLDITNLKHGRANIIISPCHSGKTTAAAKIVEGHARGPERVLYLIDTAAGKTAMINREQALAITRDWICEIDPAWWTKDPDPGLFHVMTYHQFGFQLEKTPTFPLGLGLIICDEMHNLIKYMGIEKSKNKKNKEQGINEEQHCCQKAFDSLCQYAKMTTGGPLITILTATGNALCEKLHYTAKVPLECFDYTNKVHADITRNRIFYADLPALLGTLHERAILYVPTLSMMDDCVKAADNGQRKICCLWSRHNTRQMTSEQQAVLDALLHNERIPEDIDLLIINAAYETSINIRNEDFNTMIVHSSSPDVQVQVRGRLRHDIDKLYLYDKAHIHTAHLFPKEFLDTPLTVAQVRDIAKKMNLKNEKGRVLLWPSVYKLLEKDGMSTTMVRIRGKCMWIIHQL